MSFTKRMTLTSAKLSVWTGRHIDRTLARETASSKGASSEALSTTRILVPKTMFRGISAAASQVRATWVDSTSPWLNDGTRILQNQMLDDFVEKMGKSKAGFNAEADQFAKAYGEFVESGKAKEHMGELYKADDFPDPAAIRDRFGVEVIFAPLPDAEDFRLQEGIAQERQSELEATFQQRMAELEKDTTLHWLHRFNTLLSRAEAGLEPKKQYTRSTVDKLSELADSIGAEEIDLPKPVMQAAVGIGQIARNAFDAKPNSAFRQTCRTQIRGTMETVSKHIEQLEAA